ncbi:MAG: response regulator [Flavobacteriales bacterium]|nr:response regulator [Flavobacteriales bacterium]
MKAIIIDDERLARKELRSLLNKFHEIEIVDECANADEALVSIDNHHPDLLFLDIQMPGMNGFEMLNQLDRVPKVIFVTAYDDYAIRAFEVNALDYLLKPVNPERLEEAINKVSRQKSSFVAAPVDEEPLKKLSENDQIFLKDGEKCWFTSLKDVRMFESEGNYVRVYFNEYKPLVLKSLNSLEDRLDPKVFFRANRKFIINLKWVTGIENWFNGGLQVQLRGGEKIEISRRQAARFRDLMSL